MYVNQKQDDASSFAEKNRKKFMKNVLLSIKLPDEDSFWVEDEEGKKKKSLCWLRSKKP